MKYSKNAYNAHLGSNVEWWFKDVLNDRSDVVDKIRTAFNIHGDFVVGITSGLHGEKADVRLSFACGHNVDVNVKAFGAMGFNQLTRSSVANFCKKFNIVEHQQYLENLVVNKAANKSGHLFPSKEQERIMQILKPISQDIIKWSFSSVQNKEILVLFDRKENRFYIYKMTEVLKKLGNSIKFTKGGVCFGNGEVTLQRKGGNGVHAEPIAKTEIRHPGNNLQIKLNVKRFIKNFTSTELTNFNI